MKMPLGESAAEGRDGYTGRVLDRIRQVLENEHGMREVVIRPMGASAARLSIPIRIYYCRSDGSRDIAFGKLIGSTEPFLERSIQLAKNLYLQTGACVPIFGFAGTAREMAEHQFRTMGRIHQCGVPTARPLGCHDLGEGRYLLVTEFLRGKAVDGHSADPRVVDQAFAHLSLMHQNGVFHGDIKPENILVGERVYIIDVGRFRDDVPEESRCAYDLASMMCSFLGPAGHQAVLDAAARHFSVGQLRMAADYLELVRRRPDMRCGAEDVARLAAALS
jgi:tRNA A-37 threonylcarbamoyl transferase component Bud32